jgi:hypothetical protein
MHHSGRVTPYPMVPKAAGTVRKRRIALLRRLRARLSEIGGDML